MLQWKIVLSTGRRDGRPFFAGGEKKKGAPFYAPSSPYYDEKKVFGRLRRTYDKQTHSDEKRV